ncbi:hypothetical protein ACQ9LF_01845 [Anaerohalosphaeraceae bacterium U12dextr]
MAVLLPGGILLSGHTGPLTDNSEKSTEAGIRAAMVTVSLVMYDQSHSRVRSGGDLSLSGWVVMPAMGFHRIAVSGYSVRTFCHSFNPLESTLISLDCQLQI